MNPNLQAVKIALEKVNKVEEARAKLETEQRELQTKIQALTTSVAAGNEKLVNSLTIAKSRSDVLPSQKAATDRDFSAAITELRNTLPPLAPMVAKVGGNEFRRVQAIVKEFLEGHLTDGYLIGELTRQITSNSKTVLEMDRLNAYFLPMHSNLPLEASGVIARARSAIAELGNVL